MITQFFMAAGGVVAGYVAVGLAAALGKLVVGAVLRFRFDEFIFFMICVGKKKKGLSVGLCNPQPYISCRMLDPKDTNLRNLIYEAFSMATALFFTENVCIQLYGTKRLPHTPLTVAMSVVMAAYTLVLGVRLGVTQKRKNGDNASGMMRREYERCYHAVLSGEAPGELTIQEVPGTGKLTDRASYKKYLLLCYYRCLDSGDYDHVKTVMNELENYVPEKWLHSELAMLGEFVFYYVIIAPDEAMAKYYGKPFLEKMNDSEEVNVKRTFAYWLFFIEGDKGAALQIAMEALKEVKSYRLAGCQRMERRLLEALIKKIETTP